MRQVRLCARVAGLLLAVVAIAEVQLALAEAPASAVSGSQLSFVTTSPVKTAFGANWNVQLTARFAVGVTAGTPIPSDQATVDVYLAGIAAPYQSHLPIQPDGSIYVSQSAAKPLAPGDYQMSATLVPVAGSYVDPTQTTTPLALTISAYALTATVTIDQASVSADKPVIEARLSGQFVDTTKAVPAGTWRFTVTRGGKKVVDEKVAQKAGPAEALRYAIPAELDRGADYRVSAAFTPIDSLKAGLNVTQPASRTFRTPDGGLGDPIPYPLWLLIVTIVIPLGLAVAVILLTLRLGRRPEASAVESGPTAS